MDIAKINSVLIENDINVDASFVHTLQDGAMVEYQPLLNKIIAKIEEASSYGVNVGFSQDLEKEIVSTILAEAYLITITPSSFIHSVLFAI